MELSIYGQDTVTTEPTNYFLTPQTCDETIMIDNVGYQQSPLERGRALCVRTKQGFIVDNGINIDIQRGNSITTRNMFGATSDGVQLVTFYLTTEYTNAQTLDIYYIHVASTDYPTLKSLVVVGELTDATLTSFDGDQASAQGTVLSIVRQGGQVTITPDDVSTAYDMRTQSPISSTAVTPISIMARSLYRAVQGFKPALIHFTISGGNVLHNANINFEVTQNSMIPYPSQEATYDNFIVTLDECTEFQDYSLLAHGNNYQTTITLPSTGNQLCIMTEAAFVFPVHNVEIKMSDSTTVTGPVSDSFGATGDGRVYFYKLTTSNQEEIQDQMVYLIPRLPHTESYLILSGEWNGTLTSEHRISVTDSGRSETCLNKNLFAVINPSENTVVTITPGSNAAIGEEYSQTQLDLSQYSFSEAAAYYPILTNSGYSSAENNEMVYTASPISITHGSNQTVLPNVNFILNLSIFTFDQQSNIPTYYRAPDDRGGGLTPGEIAGIVIGVLAFVAIVAIAIVCIYKRMKKRRLIEAEISDDKPEDANKQSKDDTREREYPKNEDNKEADDDLDDEEDIDDLGEEEQKKEDKTNDQQEENRENKEPETKESKEEEKIEKKDE